MDQRRPAGGTPVGSEGESDVDERPRRGRRLAIVAAFVLLVAGGVGVSAWLLTGDGGGPVATSSGSGDDDSPAASSPAATEALLQVLQTVDASEREMIEFQVAAVRSMGDPERDEPRPEEDVRADIAEAARTAAEDLRGLRDELQTMEPPEDAQAVEDTRQAYLDHVTAWIEHLDRVADDPSLALPDAPEGTYDAINSTAEDFAAELRAAVPDDAPREVQELAQLILDRGFSTEEPTGDAV